MENKKYIYSFGVEIHAMLATKTKAFSSSTLNLNKEPNSQLNQIDLAYPGTKPLVNKNMVKYAYRASKLLNMEISNVLKFDRKNYFYPDLSKGYQITQFNEPLGKKGYVSILDSFNNIKKIKLKELHMEEDTAKQFFKKENRLFDFNRAGAPLIEIVSDHVDLTTIEEVLQYIKNLRFILTFNELSNGIMANGTFRVDLNVSIRKINQKDLGQKTEIKNLNSFSNIKKSLEEEIKTQIETLERGEKVLNQTKRFDEEKQKNIVMRSKEGSQQYNFFPETNILPIKLTKENTKDFLNYDLKDTFKISNELKELGLSKDQIEIFLENRSLFDLYEKLNSTRDKRKVSNFLTSSIYSFFKNHHFPLFRYKFDYQIYEELFELKITNKITNNELKELVIELLDGKDIKNKIKSFKEVKQITEQEIKSLIEALMKSNPQIHEFISSRPERVSKFLMGNLMKETKGKLNHKVASDIIEIEIQKWIK